MQLVLQHLQHVDTAAAQYNPSQVLAVLDMRVHSQALPGDCAQMCVCVIEHTGEGLANASLGVAVMLERNQLVTLFYLLEERSCWKLTMPALS